MCFVCPSSSPQWEGSQRDTFTTLSLKRGKRRSLSQMFRLHLERVRGEQQCARPPSGWTAGGSCFLVQTRQLSWHLEWKVTSPLRWPAHANDTWRVRAGSLVGNLQGKTKLGDCKTVTGDFVHVTTSCLHSAGSAVARCLDVCRWSLLPFMSGGGIDDAARCRYWEWGNGNKVFHTLLQVWQINLEPQLPVKTLID